MTIPLRALVVASCIVITAVAITDTSIYKIFAATSCGASPDEVRLQLNSSNACAKANCHEFRKVEGQYYSLTCANMADRFEIAASTFDSYLVWETYDTNGCEDLVVANVFPVFPVQVTCQIFSVDGSVWVKAQLLDDGSVVLKLYSDNKCEDSTKDYAFTSANLSTASESHCVNDVYKFYTSTSLNSASGSSESGSSSSGDSSGLNALSVANGSNFIDASSSSSGSGSVVAVLDSDTGGSGISAGAIAGIIVAVVAVVVIIAGIVWRRRQSKDKSSKIDTAEYVSCDSPTTGQKGVEFDFVNSRGPQSLAALWDDEVIATARIPRDKVLVQQLINRGGYGEVYYGLFGGRPVAVKMLLPELRKSVKHVNDFLDEVRMLTKLDHPRIVHFVGVAWDSLTDLCVVTEYMEGGDLRALLSNYEAEGHPLGFDKTKVTIALQVAHALTYLHSLDPPVLHRDLKSKNILLSSDLDAKVTDFGVSRERVNATMTAGVGTSLWMAPEIMIGERYDGKADVFSFGVVLSELDLHALPYAHATDSCNAGKKMSDTAILHMVALGRIQVAFSSEALESMVALGMSCVALDPHDRPSAAEVLYKLQTILRQDL